jgi:hypothetical protein
MKQWVQSSTAARRPSRSPLVMLAGPVLRHRGSPPNCDDVSAARRAHTFPSSAESVRDQLLVAYSPSVLDHLYVGESVRVTMSRSLGVWRNLWILEKDEVDELTGPSLAISARSAGTGWYRHRTPPALGLPFMANSHTAACSRRAWWRKQRSSEAEEMVERS